MFWVRSAMLSSARKGIRRGYQTEKADTRGGRSTQTSLPPSGWCLHRVPMTSKAWRCIAAGSVLGPLELQLSMVAVALTGL